MRSGLFVPLFDDLADPRAVVRLAVAAEEAGWDGLFVWDHVLWSSVEQVADPWVVLSAVAAVTERIRIGPMVTPLARRRPTKIARETASLDVLSGGRFTLGVGLGSDRFGGEYSRTGDEVDDRVRAAMLDESLAILRQAWSGEPVRHRGEHYVVDGARFLPRPLQRPDIPVWVAGFPGKRAPMRRAARHDGFFPVNLTGPDAVAEIAATLRELRGTDADGAFDLVVEARPDADLAAYRDAGATWWLAEIEPPATVDTVLGIIADGPYR